MLSCLVTFWLSLIVERPAPPPHPQPLQQATPSPLQPCARSFRFSEVIVREDDNLISFFSDTSGSFCRGTFVFDLGCNINSGDSSTSAPTDTYHTYCSCPVTMVLGNENADLIFRNSIYANLEPEGGAFPKILGDVNLQILTFLTNSDLNIRETSAHTLDQHF